MEESKKTGRRTIFPHTLSLPTIKLQQLITKHKKIWKGDKYNFFFWIDPINKKAFEFKDELYDITKYLDENGFDRMNKELK